MQCNKKKRERKERGKSEKGTYTISPNLVYYSKFISAGVSTVYLWRNSLLTGDMHDVIYNTHQPSQWVVCLEVTGSKDYAPPFAPYAPKSSSVNSIISLLSYLVSLTTSLLSPGLYNQMCLYQVATTRVARNCSSPGGHLRLPKKVEQIPRAPSS